MSINVTLTFADVSELLTFFSTIQAPASGVKVQPATVEAAPAPKPAKPAAKPAPAAPNAPSQPTAEAAPSPAPAAPAPSTPQPVAETPTAAPAAASSVAYPDLQKAVLTLHKLDPTAAVPIAKSLGADTFKALRQDQWAEAHRLVTEAITARSAA